MSAITAIEHKRDGGTLSDDQIDALIRCYTEGAVGDEAMAAFAMAVCIRGMTRDETAALTKAMADSGDRMSASDDAAVRRLDKHSTGGLGDKISLLLIPMLTAMGHHVPMISGRGLGFTGGTLDKLESIPGFRTDLDADARGMVLDQIGGFIVGADDSIAPADRRLYAVRDVSGTVPSVPLIVSSILSKKLSANLNALVMDVKVGSCALMRDQAAATSLAEELIAVAGRCGLPTTAVLSAMNAPLGRTSGNAIEVAEVIEILSSTGELTDPGLADVWSLAKTLAVEAIGSSMPDANIDQAFETLRTSGKLRERFDRWVAAQGGRCESIPVVGDGFEIDATAESLSGGSYLAGFDGTTLGGEIVRWGGGRSRVDDAIDPVVGVTMMVRVGQRIEAGMPLCRWHGPADGSDRGYHDEIAGRIRSSMLLSTDPPANPLVLDRLGGSAK